MSDAEAEDFSEERFLGHVAEVCTAEPSLTPMGASILLALHFGICHDSRTFSRLFEISHALVLREVTTLAEERNFVTVLDRNPRTQRTSFALTGIALFLLTRAILPTKEA
ncbi:hypothetical protein W911_05130 [Hyphomicrobium nitrativorans NL23]|uniref:Uncharacterized protein n=1 Tax=Hyphomicrobium nitrativorans NL23 TaxID=1029756 RepID=V5SCX2_9HYPH|nr:hypothetical protein [Hyphomicrobium nitrativorans]AHB47900.1 hypothetical protein W911_05130 [Hyphomicrobium nitrativorans NL23]